MNRIVWFMWLLIVVFVVLCRSAIASTIVGGFITEDTRWTIEGSPYFARSSVAVTNGATLTIGPGVDVLFSPAVGLGIANGTLHAQGSIDAPIRFGAEFPGEDEKRWGGIVFGDGTVDAVLNDNGSFQSGSIIHHAIIEGAGANNSPAIEITKASPLICFSVIRENSSGAIKGNEINEGILISNSSILNNRTEAGFIVGFSGSRNVVLRNNTIADNLAGSTSRAGILLLGDAKSSVVIDIISPAISHLVKQA